MILVKKIFRFILIALGVLIVALILFVAVSVIPVDRTHYTEKPFYTEMMQRLDTLQNISIPESTTGFSVGYAKVNITPSFRTATAGYGKRKSALFTTVHDSIYVRTMVVSNGVERVAIVSADLLIIPPTVTAKLKHELPSIGFDLGNTYLGATHTHNSIGNWGEGATRFIYGKYDDSVVLFIAEKIKQSIVMATANMQAAKVKVGEIAIGSVVQNRLNSETGQVDSLLRVVEVMRSDSSKLLLMSYTAHATCLFSKDLEISRDYPGKLVDEMEKQGYSFAMFLAGAVGSHGAVAPEFGWACIDWMTERISQKLIENKDQLQPVNDSSLKMVRIPLALGTPQVKVLKDWRIRPWLFKTSFGEYPAYLTGLRFGNLIMLGTPCDFSGELTAPLDSIANEKDLRIMVTSFNGGYIGYITKDVHYDVNHYETRLMNWYGPGNGAYLSECLGRIIEAMAD